MSFSPHSCSVLFCFFKHFNDVDFLPDLNSAPFALGFSVSDAIKALSARCEAFLPVVEKTCATSEEET